MYRYDIIAAVMEAKTERILIRCKPDLKQKVKEVAERRGVTMTSLLEGFMIQVVSEDKGRQLDLV